MKKILYYCQYQLGIGHLARTYNIIREILALGHSVVLIRGGMPIDFGFPHKNLTTLQLDPLQMKPYTNEVFSPLLKNIQEVWDARKYQIISIKNIRFDSLVTELYPLGRRPFNDEIISLINQTRQVNQNVNFFCSVRDIIVDDLSPQIFSILKEYDYDILVHSDSDLNQLNSDLFYNELRKKVFFTGFVTNRKGEHMKSRDRRVLVSIGGGSVGHELIGKVIEVGSKLKDINFLVVCGFNFPKEIFDRISSTTEKYDNIDIVHHVQNLETLMCECQLSISMGGYNTIMNLINTSTYGLVYPYNGNSEQYDRASYFESRGFLKVVTLESLTAEMILSSMSQAPSACNLNLSGAKNSAHYILKDIL